MDIFYFGQNEKYKHSGTVTVITKMRKVGQSFYYFLMKRVSGLRVTIINDRKFVSLPVGSIDVLKGVWQVSRDVFKTVVKIDFILLY